jgi:hypothetical protein
VVVAFLVLGISGALALGFVLGRIWEMRRQIEREFSDLRKAAGLRGVGEFLRTLLPGARTRRDTGRGEMAMTDEQRIDPAMTAADREAREIAALMDTGTNLMDAIREINERRANARRAA